MISRRSFLSALVTVPFLRLLPAPRKSATVIGGTFTIHVGNRTIGPLRFDAAVDEIKAAFEVGHYIKVTST